jgi:transposase
MMGHQAPPDDPLFSYKVQLETRVRKDHLLRRIKERIDFTFIYEAVEETYGTTGHVSVPPPVILKLMLLLVLYNVRSERELMETLPERLDWLWFLGYTLETAIPDHSVLSKARRRWGEEVFRTFFESIITRCVQAGLIDGTKVFVDSSFIDAHASKDSVIPVYQEFARRLDEHPYAAVNREHLSTTDPDASLVRAQGTSRPRYKTHRAVDPAHGVITAVEVTPGVVNEAHRLLPLLDSHEETTGITASTVVADSKYGTTDNFLACHDRAVRPHMRSLAASRRNDVFPEEDFSYDPAADTYRCPMQRILSRSTISGDYVIYRAKAKHCRGCPRKTECTRNKTGRTITRHVRQELLDSLHHQACSASARRDLRARQHLMEGTFARAVPLGFKRARWRRLWRVTIQEYLTCAIQNIGILINRTMKRHRGGGLVAARPRIGTDKRRFCFTEFLPALVFAVLKHRKDSAIGVIYVQVHV